MAVSVVATKDGGTFSGRSPTVTFTSWTPAENDVVVLFPSSTVTGHTITEPSGYVNPLGAGVDVETDTHQECCVYHLVTSGEASAVTMTYTATNLYGATVTGGNTFGIVLRGVDTTTPIDSANSKFSSANTATPHVLASLTGANLSTNSMVVSCVVKDLGGDYTTAPSGWTFQVQNAGGSAQAKALLTRDTLTTASSDVTATNITPNAGDEYASITLALTAGAAPQVVTPAGATLTLTGGTPTVTTSDNQTITPAAAALTLTGSTPDVTATTNVAVSVVAVKDTGEEDTSGNPTCTFSSWTPAENDVVVLFASSTVTGHTISEPSGWVNPLGAGVDVESDTHQMCCVYHLVTAGEASAVTMTYTATDMYTPTFGGYTFGIVFRGVDPATPIDSAASTFSSVNTVTPHVLAGLVGANLSNNSLVASCVVKDQGGSYTTAPTGWTFQLQSEVGAGQARAILTRDTLTTASSDVTATNITPNAGDEYISITIALSVAVGTQTVTPAGATLTLTGSTPTITASDHKTITPTAISLTLTGSTPTVTVSDHKTTTPTAATLTLTGQTPTVTASDHQTLTPAAVTLTLTGGTPAITASDHQTLTPAGASLTLSGGTPVIVAGDHQTITPTAATLTLTGHTPTIAAGGNQTITPAGATLTLTGSTPIITASDHQTITPTGASLTLTGQTPTITGGDHQTITPTAAALVLTGHTPDIIGIAPRTITPAGGTLTLTGHVPVIYFITEAAPTFDDRVFTLEAESRTTLVMAVARAAAVAAETRTAAVNNAYTVMSVLIDSTTTIILAENRATTIPAQITTVQITEPPPTTWTIPTETTTTTLQTAVRAATIGAEPRTVTLAAEVRTAVVQTAHQLAVIMR
jgi:hypothetical protein